jgi:DNA-binding NtrC family response regulator
VTKPNTAGRVLLVDDEGPLLKAFRRVLDAAGYSVVTCDTAALALECFAQEAFDAIVSDVAMPLLSGTDLLRAVREWDRDIPVILVTGSPALDSAVEAVDLGAFKYLLKPVDNDQLVESVARAVALRRFGQNAQALRDSVRA